MARRAGRVAPGDHGQPAADAGPAVPTLISGQGQFLSTFSSQDITQEYLESLNNLYTGEDRTLAATMWANAYRLAGSNTLLVVRASKAKDIYFAKPLQKGDLNTYILRDGELLKYIPSGYKMVLDVDASDANHDQDGWSININGVGIIGNRTTDDGAQYDYFVNNLVDLVDQMNETTKFFSPSYTYYADADATVALDVTSDSSIDEKNRAKAVIFEEVYLGETILDTSDPRCPHGIEYIINCNAVGSLYIYGWNVVSELPEGEVATEVSTLPEASAETVGVYYKVVGQTGYNLGIRELNNQDIIDINDSAWSGFEAADYYAINRYNSATNLKVRIRRFNHDAVVNKELSDTDVSSLTENGESPYVVLTSVLDTFTDNGQAQPSDSILERDFYEVAVMDPSINSEVSFFNIGKLTGRGDMEESELNNLIQMIQVNLPDNLADLGLNYYGYSKDDTSDTLEQIFANLTIDPTQYSILSVSDTDLKKAVDELVLDEVYVTEGLCDLGNTEPSFQNYMANVAINSNYFYPISTINSTNYMTIGNSITKIPQDSYKLYASAPWDIDTGTLGWKYYASPAVIYWEAVARNRRNNEEFASVLGSRYGVAQYSRPVVEFNKKSRQLLLSKKVNTVKWDVANQQWEMNDCYTKTTSLGDSIVNEDGNSRIVIRIGKAMPILLRQFIGRKINEKLCEDIYSTIDYWFKTTILPMGITVEEYRIFAPYDAALAKANKVRVSVSVRPYRSLKFIDVYVNVFDTGMDMSVDPQAVKIK